MASDFFNLIFLGSCGQIFLFVTTYQSLQFRHVSTLKAIVGVKRPNWPKLFLSFPPPKNHIQPFLGKKRAEWGCDLVHYQAAGKIGTGIWSQVSVPRSAIFSFPTVWFSVGKGFSMIRTTMGLDKFRTPKISRVHIQLSHGSHGWWNVK